MVSGLGPIWTRTLASRSTSLTSWKSKISSSISIFCMCPFFWGVKGINLRIHQSHRTHQVPDDRRRRWLWGPSGLVSWGARFSHLTYMTNWTQKGRSTGLTDTQSQPRKKWWVFIMNHWGTRRRGWCMWRFFGADIKIKLELGWWVFNVHIIIVLERTGQFLHTLKSETSKYVHGALPTCLPSQLSKQSTYSHFRGPQWLDKEHSIFPWSCSAWIVWPWTLPQQN